MVQHVFRRYRALQVRQPSSSPILPKAPNLYKIKNASLTIRFYNYDCLNPTTKQYPEVSSETALQSNVTLSVNIIKQFALRHGVYAIKHYDEIYSNWKFAELKQFEGQTYGHVTTLSCE